MMTAGIRAAFLVSAVVEMMVILAVRKKDKAKRMGQAFKTLSEIRVLVC